MHEPTETTAGLEPLGASMATVLWTAALGTLVLGIYPSVILGFVNHASALVR
jgi:NADH:ubiquinone oxidoreductase subunit 2 (subunit N)